MHAVVSRGEGPSSAAAFSRKSSLVSEPIQEDPDGTKSEEEGDKDKDGDAKDDSTKNDGKAKVDEVKKETDNGKQQEKTEDVSEKEKRHIVDGVPTSTR